MPRCAVNRILIFLTVVAAFTQAQQVTPLPIIQEIDSALTDFKYNQADNLIAIALDHIESYSYSEKQQIYTFAAIRKFQQGDQFLAKDYFVHILEINPTFTLDPVAVSPKIVTLFQATKLEYLEQINSRIAKLENNITYNPVPWRSLVFPGWEQYHRGYRLKGSLWAAAGTTCLIGTLQAIIRTRSKKNEYQNANTPEEVVSSYNEYDYLYKSQFYWSYAYLTIWFASHLDALLFTSAKRDFSLSHTITPTTFTVILNYNF